MANTTITPTAGSLALGTTTEGESVAGYYSWANQRAWAPGAWGARTWSVGAWAPGAWTNKP